jgi:hypothetical protein
MSTGNICTCGHDWDWHSPFDDSDDFDLRLICDWSECGCTNYTPDVRDKFFALLNMQRTGDEPV